MRYPELPTPWEEVDDHLPVGEQERLEAMIGSRLTLDDLADDDVIKDGNATTPKSVRASYVMEYRWVRLRNRETKDEAVIRLQFKGPGSQEVYVSAVVVPFQQGREVTGSQLRNIPTSAIAATYTARQIGGTVNMNQLFTLGEGIKEDHTKALKQGRVTDNSFLAHVGIQYETLSEKYPKSDTVELMAQVNNVAYSTVKKWLSEARKRLFLMPVASGRRRG